MTKQEVFAHSNGKLTLKLRKGMRQMRDLYRGGDSAGGSAKTARDRMYQAILPIRGKILNVEKANIDKILAQCRIKTMINAFRMQFLRKRDTAANFDITKLRYDKIIIMADADVDGAHISTLL